MRTYDIIDAGPNNRFLAAGRIVSNSGRRVQVHNLPKSATPDLGLARQLIRNGDFDTAELLFESVPNVLSQLIRTAFIPSKGRVFIVADFSAIEARIIAWLAKEDWRMKIFNTHGKIYEASAAKMFKVPIEEVTKDSTFRQKGKIAELALGYGGSVGALTQMGALEMGLTEEELKPLVDKWRAANQKIVKFWHIVEETAIKAVRERTSLFLPGPLRFKYAKGILFIKLPSGRELAYVKPKIEREKAFYKDGLTYAGVDQTTRQWTRIRTFGGKIVENLIQGIARDCLAEAMLRLDAAGYDIVMHVHDEVVLDALPEDSPERVAEIMSQPINWAEGLPLQVEVFKTDFYKKE